MQHIKQLIPHFIEQIWNQQQFENLDNFLHPLYRDHSLPESLTPDAEGLKKWISATSASFRHYTTIEESVGEENKIMLKIRMRFKHIGVWRGIEATGLEISAVGYRFYTVKDGKIAEHWGLVDGQAIENQLRNASHGCKVAE